MKKKILLICTPRENYIAKSCEVIGGCSVFEHLSFIDKEIWLYRDEIMNDEVISKIQDKLASTDYKVKIVYDWKD